MNHSQPIRWRSFQLNRVPGGVLEVDRKTVAARALASSRARKEDTRRKILLGATVLARVQHGELDQATVNAWLNQSLTRPDDRVLFELPPLPPT